MANWQERQELIETDEAKTLDLLDKGFTTTIIHIVKDLQTKPKTKTEWKENGVLANREY